MSRPVHVYPQTDIIEHELEGDGCVCGPTSKPIERTDGTIGWVIVHHALQVRKDRWALVVSDS